MDPLAQENICRLCTTPGYDYHAIFTFNSSSISDKINNCLPIVIRPDDGLPSHICPQCLIALNTSDALRTQSLIADGALRQQLTAVLIKQEKDISDNESKEDDPPDTVFCGTCELNFDDINSFDDHMRNFHSSQWICNLCSEDFKTSDALLQHKHINHYEIADDGGDDHVYKMENPENSDRHDSDFSADPSDREEELDSGSVVGKRAISCTICEVQIPSEDLMAVHQKFHEPRVMYCSQCFHSYPTPYDLFCHKQEVHKIFLGQKMRWFCEQCERFSPNPRFLKKHDGCKKIKFKCKYCNEQYITQKELIMHQKKNHLEKSMNDPDIEKFKCPTCEKVYIDKVAFRGHVRMHRVRLEKRYSCPHCDKNFLSPTQLRGHMDDIHVKKRDRQCDVCGKAFTSNRSLTAHRKRHIDQTCRECGKLFENIRILNKHLLAVHNITAPATGKFVCKECGKKFLKLRLLKDHRNIHSGQRPHICDICKETFRTYAARWSHMQKHKNDGFFCDYCKRKFSTKGHVRRHMACHLTPDNWNYECKICNQRFHRKSHLSTHMKKHNDTRPYQCDICEARFLREKFLLQHKKRRHNQALPMRIRIKIPLRTA